MEQLAERCGVDELDWGEPERLDRVNFQGGGVLVPLIARKGTTYVRVAGYQFQKDVLYLGYAPSYYAEQLLFRRGKNDVLCDADVVPDAVKFYLDSLNGRQRDKAKRL